MAAKKEKSVEETFQELEEIIRKLESGESSLEESFKYYEAGMKLVKSCNEKIGFDNGAFSFSFGL